MRSEKEKFWRCLDLRRRGGSSGITRTTEAHHTRLCGGIVCSQCSGEEINYRCQTAVVVIFCFQKEGFSRTGAGRKMLGLLKREAMQQATKGKKECVTALNHCAG